MLNLKSAQTALSAIMVTLVTIRTEEQAQGKATKPYTYTDLIGDAVQGAFATGAIKVTDGSEREVTRVCAEVLRSLTSETGDNGKRLYFGGEATTTEANKGKRTGLSAHVLLNPRETADDLSAILSGVAKRSKADRIAAKQNRTNVRTEQQNQARAALAMRLASAGFNMGTDNATIKGKGK